MHYEVRSEYSRQLGEALARIFDKQVMRVAVQAARESNKITGLPGGSTITATGYDAGDDAAKAVVLADAIFAAHQNFLENDVDPNGAFVLIRPGDYFRLVRNKDLLNTDWGGLGSYARAELPMVGGLPLVVTNHVPAQNDATASTDDDGNRLDGIDLISPAYTDDYSKVLAVVMKPDAVGTVKLLDINLQSEWDIRRQGTLMVARMATGHGVLRPECAQEIISDAV